jgi:hypothetical protein
MDEATVIAATRRWIADVVIGLNLCPFAGRVFQAGTIRYVVTEAAAEEELLDDLARELRALEAAPAAEVETTLLIHPHLLGNFLDYNDFLDLAEALVARLGLEGVVQLAGFHPGYQFAGTASDAVENYTNRSPYPMLHLLREDSISRAADDPDALADIPRANIETMRRLGQDRMREKLRAIAEPGPRP